MRKKTINVYDLVKNEINKDVNFLHHPQNELQILMRIKKILIICSQIFCRDDCFFLFKEDLKIRKKIYNKRINIYSSKDNKISCKSFAKIIKKLIYVFTKVKVHMFSNGNDKFKHWCLLYRTHKKIYYIDPLHDLVNYQIGAKSEFFCSHYKHLPNVSIVNNEQSELIDSAIDYPNKGAFFEDVIKAISFNSDEGYLEAMQFISDHTNSVTDFVVACKKLFQTLNLTFDYYKFETFIVSEAYVLDNRIKPDKSRGCLIFIKNSIFYYLFDAKILSKISIEEINFLKKQCKIFIRPTYQLNNYKILKDKGASRILINNLCFQKEFYELEKNNVINIDKDFCITYDKIFIKSLKTAFYIKNSTFNKKVNKTIYKYKVKDECRNVYVNNKLVKNYFNDF